MSHKTALDNNQKALLALVSESLFGIKAQFDEGTDWSVVWKEAFFQGVSSIAFAPFDLSSLEDESLEREIKEMINKQLISTSLFFERHTSLSSLLSASKIPHTIIKGCASALLYPEPVLRAIGDIDFDIPREYLQKATDLLATQGIIGDKIPHGDHDVFFDQENVRYEMHFEPSGIPNGKPGEIIRSYFEDLIDCAVPSVSDFGEMKVPSVFHHGLIVLLHNAHHLTGEGIGLRQLCDWAVFINRFENDDFTELFYDKLLACGLWEFARLQTALCVKYLGCKAKEFAEGIDEETLDKLMLDILSGGNFGQKDSDRGHEALILSLHGKEGVGNKSNTSQFIQSVNDIVFRRWKLTKKVKILLPLGWVFFGGRYVLRSLIGKRPKIHVRQTVREANERKELYRQLKLFETGE